MSQPLQPLIRTVTAAEVDPTWIATVAEIIRRDGHGVRAGGSDRIEVRSIHAPYEWGVLSPRFVNAEERDKVLAQLYPI